MSAVQTRGLGVVTGGRWLGLLVGLAISSWLLSGEDELRALMFLGPALGFPLLGGVLLGALVRPGPERGPARRALLETRRIETYLPRWSRLVRWMAYGDVGLTVLGVLQNRPAIDAQGNKVWYYCGDGLGLSAIWPPGKYMIPSLSLVLLGLGAAVGALHLVVRQPRPAGIDVAEDDRARADTVAAVLAACAVLMSVPLAGLALTAAESLGNDCSGPLGELAAVPLLCLVVAALAVGVWAALALLVPRGRS